MIRNFRDYPVWQESIDFATKIYEVTSKLPWFEKKGLCDQLQRAVVSISSNIAEGSSRNSEIEFAHFLEIALGSAFETETQLTIAKNIGYIDNATCATLIDTLDEIEKQLNGLISRIRANQNK